MDLPLHSVGGAARRASNGRHALRFPYREAGDRLDLRIQNQLLTRAVMVIDQRGVIRFLEIVPDVSGEPDYDAVLNAAKALRG